MRRIGTMFAAACVMLLPQQVLATVYDFHETEIPGFGPSPTTFDFSLDTSTATVSGGSTLFSNVAIIDNGTTSRGNTVGAEFDTNISSPLFFLVDTSLAPFSSGAGPSLAFGLGNFNIADGLTDGEGVLTISSVSSVPEPSTCALMVVGIGLLGAIVRFSRRPQEAAA